MQKKLRIRILYSIYVLFASVLLFEAILRIILGFSLDRRSFYHKWNIPPDKAYWTHLLSNITDTGYVTYDPQLGWGINPNKVSGDSMYVSNFYGIRDLDDFDLFPDTAVIRIALFGDSYTHGDEVSNKETWAFFLEEELKAKGIACEVLNFGVGGYGMDQAYLRFVERGKQVQADVVVLGLQVENFWRNLNVFRPNYSLYGGIPLTKPRGIIRNDSLFFINQPTVAKDSILNIIINSDTGGVLQYEYFHHNKLVARDIPFSWLYTVKVIRGVFSDHYGKNHLMMEDCEEGNLLMRKIIRTFEKEVNQAGASFVLLQLPTSWEVDQMRQYGVNPPEAFLKNLFAEYSTCETTEELSNYQPEKLYHGHFSKFGNQIVAEHFANWLISSGKLKKRQKTNDNVRSFQL